MSDSDKNLVITGEAFDEKSLQVGFYVNKDEKKKLLETADHLGLGVSALMRMLIIRAWRSEVKGGK